MADSWQQHQEKLTELHRIRDAAESAVNAARYAQTPMPASGGDNVGPGFVLGLFVALAGIAYVLQTHSVELVARWLKIGFGTILLLLMGTVAWALVAGVGRALVRLGRSVSRLFR